MLCTLATLIALSGLVPDGDSRRQKPPAPTRPRGDARSTTEDSATRLRISRAIVCRSIEGFEKYEPLPDASLTADEKLLIYYQPLNYATVHQGDEYRVHLIQDGQIRRAGEKSVLRRKQNILDYEPRRREPLGVIFLKNAVPLKGLPPGDYVYDILLRDGNQPGPPALQSVKFRIVRAEVPRDAKAEKNRARKGSARARGGDGDQGEIPLPFFDFWPEEVDPDGSS